MISLEVNFDHNYVLVFSWALFLIQLFFPLSYDHPILLSKSYLQYAYILYTIFWDERYLGDIIFIKFKHNLWSFATKQMLVCIVKSSKIFFIKFLQSNYSFYLHNNK